MNDEYQILHGDCIEMLKTLPDESVHCCVTSPPYFGLRNYSCEGQIGLEATPQLFIAKMVEVFEEVRRVLRKDGVLFLNLGDSYAANRGNGASSVGKKQATNPGANLGRLSVSEGFKEKDLMLIPHRVVIALQDAGWWVRSDMPWVKRSAMPESVTDRPAKALEYVFMLTKSAKYYFDMAAVRVTVAESQIGRVRDDQIGGNKGVEVHHSPGGRYTGPDSWKGSSFEKGKTGEHQLGRTQKDRDRSLPTNRNGITGSLDNWGRKSSKSSGELDAAFSGNPPTNYERCGDSPAGGRSWRNSDLWYSSIAAPHGVVGVDDELVGLDVNPAGYKDAHFATFPTRLVEPLVKMGSSEYGCCASCGASYERVLTVVGRQVTEAMKIAGCDFDGEYHGQATKDFESANAQNASDTKRRILEKMSQITESGWQKTCSCPTDERVPATVLDPFMGAGTTLLVAKRLGRRGLGIELNPDYIKLAETRLEHWHKPTPPQMKEDADNLPLFDVT